MLVRYVLGSYLGPAVVVILFQGAIFWVICGPICEAIRGYEHKSKGGGGGGGLKSAPNPFHSVPKWGGRFNLALI